jgi:hypothetical protein
MKHALFVVCIIFVLLAVALPTATPRLPSDQAEKRDAEVASETPTSTLNLDPDLTDNLPPAEPVLKEAPAITSPLDEKRDVEISSDVSW